VLYLFVIKSIKSLEWEKKYLDKETEFSRYKEREHLRPEVKLQSDINMLNLERVELERKLDAMTKAKNHYKEQWTRAVQEIALNKKREEANAKAVLKKQQQELEHLRMRYLAAEENELLKNDHKSFESLRNEVEK
jgi:centrosomal protein CEP120